MGQLVNEKTFSLLLPNTYSQQDTTLHISMDQPGLYECVVTVPGQQLKTINTVSVTRLAAIYRNLSGNKQEVMVTDYLSGKPVDGAIVTYYGGQRRNLQELGTVKTDREGLATLPANSQVLAFQASRPGDTNAMLTNIYPMGFRPQTGKEPGRSLDLYGPWTLPSGTNHFLQRSRLRKRLERPACRGRTDFYGDFV